MAGSQQRFTSGPRGIGSLILWGGLLLYVGLLAGAYDALRGSSQIYLVIPLLAILVPLPLLAVLSRIHNRITGVKESVPLRLTLPEKMGGSPALVAHLSRSVAEHPQADCFLCNIELFFEGNDDPGSIAANMAGHPGLAAFRDCLTEIRAKPGVQDVLIGIVDFPEGEWPYAEMVLVLTSAGPAMVSTWAAGIDPDEVGAGLRYKTCAGIPVCRPGMQPVCLWWD